VGSHKEEERCQVAVVHAGKKTTEGVVPSPYHATRRVIGGPFERESILVSRPILS
jgi:hypothetical protein